MTGDALTFLMRWATIVIIYVKSRLDDVYLSNTLESGREKNSKVSKLRFGKIAHSRNNPKGYFPTSTAEMNSGQSTDLISGNLHEIPEEAQYHEPMIDQPIDLQMDMLKKSLQEFGQTLDEINKNIATQIKKGIEGNYEEMKETFKLRHTETKRRLDRLEKKTK